MKLSDSYLHAMNLTLVLAVQAFKKAPTVAMLPGPFYIDNYISHLQSFARNMSNAINEH